MTIRLAINASPMLLPLTGIGQYTRHLLCEIEKCPDIRPYYFYAGRWAEGLTDSPPAIWRLRALIAKLGPQSHTVGRAIQQLGFSLGVLCHRFHLYHEPNYLPFRFDGPTVITVHDLSYLRYPEMHPRVRVEMMQRLLPPAIEKAKFILTDSEFVRQEIIAEFGIESQRVVTTSLGVSPSFRQMNAQETSSCMKQYGLQHGSYLLAVGTLEPRKNILQVLKAYQVLEERVRKEFPLVIAGMKGWLTGEVEAEMRDLTERRQVRLLGYVPNELLPQLYSGARMLLYPSIYEGFGLPPLEAMASGTPVIVSDQSSLPEVAGTAGILLPPRDIDAMCGAIMSLIEDETERSRRVAAGLAQARKFTWERCAAQTLAVYCIALG